MSGKKYRIVKNAVSKGTPGPAFNQYGQTGLNRDTWYVNEEFLNDLRGVSGIRVYKEMRENDPVIGATFFAIEMFLRRVPWFVDAASDSDKAKENATFLEECRNDMSITWPDFISEVMSMMQYGWSWFEELYKYRNGPEPEPQTRDDGSEYLPPPSKYEDGKIGWDCFDPRSQDSFQRWQWDEKTGELLGMWQRPAPNYTELFIPKKKSLLFRTESRKKNPEGRSVLRNAYRPYYFKKRIEEIEGIGVERDLAGLPFAEVPAEMLHPNASDADKATVASIVQLVKNIRRDQQEGVVWPQAWDENGNRQYEFKLMSSGGSRQFSTDQIITRYEQRMAMTVLADFILLGNDSTGSFAMSTTKSGLFQSALGAWLDMIQDVLNNEAIPRLFKLNGITDELPKFRHDEVQKPALSDLAVYVAALAGAGAQLFPDTDLENHFRRLAQLPERQPSDVQQSAEGQIHDEKLLTDIEQMKAAQDQAKNPQKYAEMNRPPVQPNPGSPKTDRQQAGAPTKTTGPVKSKLPPAQRRKTKKDVAARNESK